MSSREKYLTFGNFVKLYRKIHLMPPANYTDCNPRRVICIQPEWKSLTTANGKAKPWQAGSRAGEQQKADLFLMSRLISLKPIQLLKYPIPAGWQYLGSEILD